MKVRITSFRGDHQAVLETEVAEALFNKMSGKTTAALSAEIKAKVPDTFWELKALWEPGEVKYPAIISQDKDGEMIGLREFKPEAEIIVAIAPITGG